MSIKIKFTDFWDEFDPEDNYLYNHLKSAFDVELSENPDVLFYSVFGKKYLNYKCIRIFFTGENRRSDFTGCDYAIGFDFSKNPKYLRLPLYLLYLKNGMEDLIKPADIDADAILKNKSRFCNMIVSNGRSKKRISFFHKLSKYKKVDSGGKYLNNIGGPVTGEAVSGDRHIINPAKLHFIRHYKFTIAFENKSFPGYTTEKIIEPMLENSVPVYFGNPLVDNDFNTKSFLNYHDYGSDEKLIEKIIELDKNDELYKQYLRQPYLPENKVNPGLTPAVFINFMRKVFADSAILPVARRKPVLHFINRKIIRKLNLKKKFD